MEGSDSDASAENSLGFNIIPRAAVPIPEAIRPKKWRRVSNKSCSCNGSIDFTVIVPI
jgi:hypothetical protein